MRLGLPVVVVARTTLGTINHTMSHHGSTARSRSLHVAGVVMVGDPNSDNRAAIERYGRVDVLAEMPRFDPTSHRSRARANGHRANLSRGSLRMSLIDRDRACLWHPYTQMLTRRAAAADRPRRKASTFTPRTAASILDGISSWWVNIHGHSHPKLNEALAAQARELEHVVFAGCTHRPAVELAERLLEVLPPWDGSRVLFRQRLDSGGGGAEDGLPVLAKSRAEPAPDLRDSASRLSRRHRGRHVGQRRFAFHAPFATMLFPVSGRTRPIATVARWAWNARRARSTVWAIWNAGCANSAIPWQAFWSSRCCRPPAA